MSEHSLISPSSLERVCNCPASVRMSQDSTVISFEATRTESEAAKEGTLFHKCMETLLNGETNTSVSDVNDEMMYYVNQAYQWLMNFPAYLIADRIDIEKKLSMTSIYSGDNWGTVDFGCVYDKSNVLIVDWKYGRGHEVSVEDNKQLIAYALAYVNEVCTTPPTHITTVIYQPRINSESPAKSITYSYDELKKKGDFIRTKVDEAYIILLNNEEDITLHAGEHCMFCPAKAICCEYRKRIMSKDTKEALALINDLRPPIKLTDEELKRIIEFKELVLPKLNSYIDDVSDYLRTRLLTTGAKPIEGLTLVSSRSRKKWINDEQEILNVLTSGESALDESQCVRTSLKTLTEIKALLKSKGLSEDYLVEKGLVTSSEGAPKVMLSSETGKSVTEDILSLITDL